MRKCVNKCHIARTIRAPASYQCIHPHVYPAKTLNRQYLNEKRIRGPRDTDSPQPYAEAAAVTTSTELRSADLATPDMAGGQKPMVPFWGRCTAHFRTYSGGDWDVHWGYGILIHGHMEPTKTHKFVCHVALQSRQPAKPEAYLLVPAHEGTPAGKRLKTSAASGKSQKRVPQAWHFGGRNLC